MMDEKQEERTFTVTDKRFSARRETGQDQASDSSQSREATKEPQSYRQEPTEAHTAATPEEVDFTSFIMSLGTQAFMHLGDIPNPVTQKREKDVVGAKHMIDLLSLLEVKTKGNLTAEEERLLQRFLFDLRLRYVREVG